RPDVDTPGLPERHAPELEQGGVFEPGLLARLVLSRDEAVEVACALWIGDLRRVLPCLAAVAGARELGAPVAVAEQCPQGARVRVADDEVDAHAGMARQRWSPVAADLFDDERTLAGADENALGH